MPSVVRQGFQPDLLGIVKTTNDFIVLRTVGILQVISIVAETERKVAVLGTFLDKVEVHFMIFV